MFFKSTMPNLNQNTYSEICEIETLTFLKSLQNYYFFKFFIFQIILAQNPQKYGQNVLFGQIVTLGIKSLGKMSSWANCHIGHKVFGQYVTMGILSLGILKTWAF